MRRGYCTAAMLATLTLWGSLAVAGPVLIESGALQGVTSNGLTVYKGVPYAAPPLGNLRWREPKSVAPWKGLRKADSFAPACLQKGVSMPGEKPSPVSEDCLYLNIWTPARRATDHLPVIVWIHGGGYSNGSASMPLYWGDRLAHKGVIVVTIAYRLYRRFVPCRGGHAQHRNVPGGANSVICAPWPSIRATAQPCSPRPAPASARRWEAMLGQPSGCAT